MTCFWRFSGQWKYGGACQSYCGSAEGKKTCGTRKCHCKREKETKNQLLRVWEREKAAPDPKMQKKRVWKVDFHESDPNERKISLHNAKKYAIAGLREKKSRVRPAHCYAGREDPRNIWRTGLWENFTGGCPKRPEQTTTGWNSQEKAEGRARKNPARTDEQKETGIYNRLEEIGGKRNEVTDNGLKK